MPHETPIIMGPVSIRQTLAGKKLETRRILKPQPPSIVAVKRRAGTGFSIFTDSPSGFRVAGPVWAVRDLMRESGVLGEKAHPHWRHRYGRPGDVLWFKETWRPQIAHSHGMNSCDCGDVVVRYAADKAELFFAERELPPGWCIPKSAEKGMCAPLFMPKWARRILVRVTDVRIEPLWDITEEAIVREGCTVDVVAKALDVPWSSLPTLHSAYRAMWDRLNDARGFGWDDNPWVWVLSYELAETRREDGWVKAA